MQDTLLTTPKPTDRLAQLWEDLLADPVPPSPIAKSCRTLGARFESNDVRFLPLASDQQRPSWLGMQESRWMARSTAVLEEAEQWQPVFLSHVEPVSRSWRVNLATWFHSLLELVAANPPASADEAISEGAALPEMSIRAAHEASLSLFSPFRWEPKPAWINAPVRPNPPHSNTTDPRRFAPRTKIPLRPLHKQSFYRRFFFYLRRWLSRSV